MDRGQDQRDQSPADPERVSGDQAGDRRRAERYPEHLSVTYSLLADDQMTPVVFHDTETLDISRSGVRVQFGEEVQAGTLIQLCLRIPTLKNPMLMMGKVLWCGQLGEGVFQAGVQFLGNLPPGLEQIVATLSRLRRGAGGTVST